MQISDISAYLENARPHAGDKQVVEKPSGKVVRHTQSKQPEPAATGADAECSSDDIYKGNFINIYA